MKLGNISQTIVQVPNFFINRKLRSIDTFELHTKTESDIKFNPNSIKKKNIPLKQKIKTELDMESNFSSESTIRNKSKKRRNSNFTDKKILTTYYDMNINNNPRYRARYWINFNKEKFLPVYYTNNVINKTQTSESFFPEIVDMNNPENEIKKNKKNDTYQMFNKFYNYKKYKESTDILKLLSPDLRNELMDDTRNLIDRINMNYDLKEWNKFDARTTSNRYFQTEYSPITKVVKNTPSIKDKFIDTLNQKAMGLKTVNNQVKKNNIKIFYNKIDNENNEDNNRDKSFDILLEKNKSNLLKLKYNNDSKIQYNENDKMFIKEYEYITKKLNKTKMYKAFPSKTREEFNTKKIVKYKDLFKINKPIKKLIKKQKYGDDKDFSNNKNKKGENNFLEQMWKRPLHKDAFKLND